MLSLSLLRYVGLAVRRDRIIWLMFALMFASLMVSLFLGEAATLESDIFSIALAGTIMRTVAMLGLVIFISFFMRRLFESREIDYLLATTLTRTKFLLSLTVAFSLLALLLSAMISLVLAGMLKHFSGAWLIWSCSVGVELVITSVMTMFFAVVLRSPTISALCSLGYYSLARLMGMMIGIIEFRYSGAHGLMLIPNWVVKILSVITPRFDLLAQTSWLVMPETLAAFPLWLLPVQLFVFCAFFFTCALSDLKRVQF